MTDLVGNDADLSPLLTCPDLDNSFLVDSDEFRVDSEMAVEGSQLGESLEALVICMNGICVGEVSEIGYSDGDLLEVDVGD